MQIVNVCLTILTLGSHIISGERRKSGATCSATRPLGMTASPTTGLEKSSTRDFSKPCWHVQPSLFFAGAAHTFLELPRWIDLLSQTLARLVLFLYVPVAMVNARRYRCSRTSWRGIRFSFRGRTSNSHALLSRWGFTILTLGSYYPYFQLNARPFSTHIRISAISGLDSPATARASCSPSPSP